MRTLLGIVCVTSLISAAGAARVLIAISDFESQMSYTVRLAKDLYSQGHDITILVGSNLLKSFSTLKNDNEINYMKFDCQDPVFVEKEKFQSVAHMLMRQSTMLSRWTSFNIEEELLQEYGYCLFEDQQAIKDLHSRKFDFVLVSATNAPFLFIPYMLQVPYAIITLDCFNNFRRIPVMPSYVPHVIMPCLTTWPSRNVSLISSSQLLWQFEIREDMMWVGSTCLSFRWLDTRDCSVMPASVCSWEITFLTSSALSCLIPYLSPAFSSNPLKICNPTLPHFVNNARNGFIIVSLGTIEPDPPEAMSGIITDALQTSPYSVLMKKKFRPPNTTLLFCPGCLKMTC